MEIPFYNLLLLKINLKKGEREKKASDFVTLTIILEAPFSLNISLVLSMTLIISLISLYLLSTLIDGHWTRTKERSISCTTALQSRKLTRFHASSTMMFKEERQNLSSPCEFQYLILIEVSYFQSRNVDKFFIARELILITLFMFFFSSSSTMAASRNFIPLSEPRLDIVHR